MSETNVSIVLAKRPKDSIVPGETFRVEKTPAPKEADLKSGEVLVETLYLSLDPAMRGWLNDARSYLPPVQIGEVMRGGNLCEVKASRSDKFRAGDLVSGTVGWTEQAIVRGDALHKIELPRGAKLTDAMGVLGMTGLTAYFGILDIGAVKAGDFVVVSGAAGATGSVVCQIAKLKGATVLGLAGSDDKVAWLKGDVGCDDALNYKHPDFHKQFRDATKGFIDVYFDNVGGEILDMALGRAKQGMRVVACGAISAYNTSEVRPVKNYTQVIAQRIRWQGFIVFDYAKQWAQARKELAGWLAEGKLKSQETIIKGGLLKAEEGLAQLFQGVNTGKMLVEIRQSEVKSSL